MIFVIDFLIVYLLVGGSSYFGRLKRILLQSGSIWTMLQLQGMIAEDQSLSIIAYVLEEG